jgi:transcriptional regulator with GAF, ATPase, and Fis domain
VSSELSQGLPEGFQILEQLGPGVHRVQRGEQQFVLRVAPERAGMESEWAALSRVQHPRLVLPVEWGGGGEGAEWWSIRPYVPGVTLDQALSGAEPESRVAWVLDLLGALGHLHQAGLVHRDLRGPNVVIGADGAYLVDLDLVAATGAGAAGTATHLAPEVRLGQPYGIAADLFALGVTLATALLGAPDDSLAARFPGNDFWQASGLDPDALPAELAPLVRRLLLRRPQERPADTAAAAELLSGSGARLPDLGLPELAGRRSQIELLARQEGGALLAVEFEEDCTPALRELELAQACAGVSRSGGVIDGRELPLSALVEQLARGVEGVVVLPSARATEVVDALDVEGHGLRPHRLGGLPVNVLEQVLERLTGGVAPQAVANFAADLHAWSGGRQSLVERALRAAPGLGILEPADSRWALVIDRWPRDQSPEGLDDPRLDELDPEALLLLALMDHAALGGTSEAPQRAGRSLGWSAREWGPRLAALRGARLVDGAGVCAPGVGAAAQARVEQAGQDLPLDRLLQVLEDEGVPAPDRAPLAVLAARDAASVEGVLDLARQHLARGAHTRARGLARAVDDRARVLELPQVCAQVCVLEARLDLAQLDVGRAETRLREAFGVDYDGAPHGAWIVAARAAELAGDRDLARSRYERCLDLTRDEELRLRAVLGLGYLRLLAGDPQGAMAQVDARPRPEDASEPAAGVHNLRFAALVRLGRTQEAGLELDAAEVRAAACGDPTLEGRTALNRAYLSRREGDLESACRAVERAAAHFERAGNLEGRAQAANNGGVLLRDLGDLGGARLQLGRALRLRRQLGDAYGEASSRASLAMCELEAGRPGVALELGERAAREFEAGGYSAENRVLGLHLVQAQALLGRFEPARKLLARHERGGAPLHVARARAILAWAEGDTAGGAACLRAALAEWQGGEVAELLRAAAVWQALDPDDPAARAALESAGPPAGEARVREVRWRLQGEGVSLEALTTWREAFEDEGRLDLAHAAAVAASSLGGPAERRTARAAADAAAEAMLEQVPPERREASLARLAHLARDTQQKGGLETAWFLECNRSMASALELEELLGRIVDMAVQVTGAQRGFLVLLDGERVEARVSRGAFPPELEADVGFSTGVVHEALRAGRGVLSVDASTDERFQEQRSVRQLELRAVLCVPFQHEEVRGAVYLDHAELGETFDEADLRAVTALSDQAAIAIGVLRQRERIEELNSRLRTRVATQEDELKRARAQLRRAGHTPPVGGLVGESSAMLELHEVIQRLGPTALPVLVTGPSGAGKDLVARALHGHSSRADGPFVVVNSAALPDTLLESELFGHVRGAFTGANEDRAGLFVEADGGTFFLDEIGDLPLPLQAKLLRVLESGEVRPVGGSRTSRVEVRVVAATNRALPELVEEGKFRRDLYYRLNAAEIAVPSLADRPADIPLLAKHFLESLNEAHGRPMTFGPPVMAALARRPWPGEVRELSNEVARLFFLADGDRVDDPGRIRAPVSIAGGDPMPSSLALIDVERAAVVRALEAAGGKRARAAELLGISRAGLYTKLKRLGLDG